jgi:transcriptional regulator with XRE-family HTH domain
VFEPDELGPRRSRLADVLRELRKQAGLSGDRLAARSGISQSKISKIENGRILPSVLDVERILNSLDVPETVRAEVSVLARLANTEFQDLRSLLRRGLHHRQRELAVIEAETVRFRYFLPTMITGLLQTADYLRAALADNPVDLSRTVMLKLDRQAVLYDRTKTFSFLLTEAAVRWQLCPPLAMAAQMDRLVSVSCLPNVHLSVIPLARHVPAGPLNTFTVYDERLATAEVLSGLIVMRDPRDVRYHLERFAFFESHTCFGAEVREILGRWAEEFRTTNSTRPEA